MHKVVNALAALVMIATPVGALENKTVGVVEGWTIVSYQSGCAFNALFDNGTRFHVQYDQRKNQAIVSFSDVNAKSLRQDDKRKLKLIFAGGERIDEGWGENEFTVTAEEGTNIRTFSAAFNGLNMLNDVAKYSRIAFLYNEKIVQVFNLDGSAAAVARIKECAAQEAKLHPSDIFE